MKNTKNIKKGLSPTLSQGEGEVLPLGGR